MTNSQTLQTSKRQKFIAGNWKMNKSRQETDSFFAEFFNLLPKSSPVFRTVDVGFAVPYTLIDQVTSKHAGNAVKVLAQNCHEVLAGAYTGEISVPMLADLCAQGSLIGHSERRQYFGETDERVGKKWQQLSSSGLLPVICVGETRAERDGGETLAVIQRQLFDAMAHATQDTFAKDFVIAYEPVWAIGTGLTATPEDANHVHKVIRKLLSEKLTGARADEIRIIYGGSMNAANAKDLLSQSDIDGGLIGGASLKAADFAKIVSSAY